MPMSDLIPSNLGNFIFSLDNLDNSKTLFLYNTGVEMDIKKVRPRPIAKP